MTPREIVHEQIAHHETDIVPYTLAFEPGVSERLDQHFGGDEWRKRLVQHIVYCGGPSVPPNRLLDPAHYRDAFGSVWRIDGEVPSVVDPGLKSPDFEGYDFPAPEDFLNDDAKVSVKKLVAESSDRFTIVAPGLCLWETWYIRGFETTLMDCAAEEGFYAELLERMTELCLGLIEACADIPADGIFMGDDWGNQRGITIGPERWRRFTKPQYARIFQAIHDQGKLALMHSCGSVADIVGDLVEIGLDVLESVQPEAVGMNPYGLKRAWGDKITFWGGLGSQHTIPFGTPDEIRREVRRLRSEMSVGGGYILAPAKPIRPETPAENALAVVEEFLA